MTPTEFCYWLQGALELGSTRGLNEQQLKVVKSRLREVFGSELEATKEIVFSDRSVQFSDLPIRHLPDDEDGEDTGEFSKREFQAITIGYGGRVKNVSGYTTSEDRFGFYFNNDHEVYDITHIPTGRNITFFQKEALARVAILRLDTITTQLKREIEYFDGNTELEVKLIYLHYKISQGEGLYSDDLRETTRLKEAILKEKKSHFPQPE